MQLNEEQTLAVQHPVGHPACLIAGAGSGKTRVLTERVRWLMDQGISPRRILAVTFTNKAAGELVERIGIGQHTPRDLVPRVSTIHSLSLSAIRRNPLGFGLQEKVSPLDDYDSHQMMKKIIERVNSEENPYRVLEMIGFHRARGCGFSKDYSEEIHEVAKKMHGGYHALEKSVVALWKLYEEEKVKNSVVDFDDMIHLVVRRAKEDYVWRSKLERIYEHVLMDEAQDTNPIQWEFINLLLAADNPNIYVVGDMSQSIYAFNGAVPQILKDFSENWRGLHPALYRIARNHRSVPEIVRLANVVQSKMTQTIPLQMESWRGMQGEKGTTKLLKGRIPYEVANTISHEIYQANSLKNTGHIPYKDNCLLVRSAIQIRDLEGALVRLRIPYIVRGGRGLLQTEEVRDVLSYLRFATNTKDFMALVRSASVPRRGIGEVALERIRESANQYNDGNLLEAIRGNSKLAIYAEVIDAALANETQPVQALDTVIQLTGYKKYIQEKYSKKGEQDKAATKIENLDRFREMFEGLLEDGHQTLADMVFQLSIDRQSDDDQTGKVTISTIHSAKGLEWPRCYVIGVVEGYLPHRFSMGNPEEIEEERRLFYVAITRARDICVLCTHSMEQKGPHTQAVAPSRFLHEIGII